MAPGSQEGEQSLLQDVENRGQEECDSQEDEQFISELSTVVLSDELPAEVDRPRHGLKLIIGLLDGP